MPPRRRIPVDQGQAAVEQWRSMSEGGVPPRATLATAVRHTLEELSIRAPGNAVEVRIPPLGAVQCLPGPRHTRGTPPNVVETDPQTWLKLVIGALTWGQAQAAGAIRASGTRADLSDWLPLFP